ncbi:carbohydrate-binding protein [Amycolatopsis tolypomycina]|uniref:carbohydrate-binding protein n=1 Tax=Amycolatopsis tolypomycina TaxID=208445 RepID=UPI000A7551BD|nr:carbohydrate-binding protein [Amycolatopsis tolypomycina]
MSAADVPQNDWDFTRFSVRFAGATPPQTTPTTTPTTPGGGSCAAAEWDRTKVYVKDDVVSHNSHQWTAKWWTQGEEPGTTGEWGVWQDNGAC